MQEESLAKNLFFYKMSTAYRILEVNVEMVSASDDIESCVSVS